MFASRRPVSARGIAGALLVSAWLTASAGALEVRERRWGFDGQVVPERFAVLSVLVENDSPQPFDGLLQLQPEHGFATQTGATYLEPCYLAPFSRRWVQFYPRVTQETSWVLRWGRGRTDRVELPAPRFGPPASVGLVDPQDPRAWPGTVRAFPENLFPPTAAALDGLHAVVVDHVPRWEAARRAALRDWLRGGGTLHLLPGDDGQFPVFGEELAILNDPAETFRVGTGRVQRHPVGRAQLGPDYLAARGAPSPVLAESHNTLLYQFDDALARTLSPLSQPRHAWGWFYSLTLVYLLAVGPGNFVLSRRARDYRLVLLIFAGGVAGFALLFAVLGRRGQGESNQVHAVTYARSLGGGEYLVTQWLNLFMTRGDHYTVHHPATHNLYALSQEYEAAPATIAAGRDGAVQVEIPVFSRRSLVHQAKMSGPDLGLRVVTWPDAAGAGATLEIGPGFPNAPLALWALHGRQFRQLVRRDNHLVASAGTAESWERMFAGEHFTTLYTPQIADPFADVDASAGAEPFQRLLRPLIGYGLGGVAGFRHYLEPPPDDPRLLQVFVFAPAPATLGLGDPTLGRETGCVLYHCALWRETQEVTRP